MQSLWSWRSQIHKGSFMSNKDKKHRPSVVTLIEDPYGLNTLEISDAQNNPEELDLDRGMEEHSELIDDQLNKLAQAIADQEVEEPVKPDFNPDAELAAQIAEDQALI